LQPGAEVSCGEKLGAIGSSGNALNPHLHLEARAGPAGADFASMAHYDASASPAEMRAYCDWRVSGLFQLIDPMLFFVTAP
jgi:murein DD-endopeptidase MepM/ murein hydrolase activator NlpD